MKRPQENSDVQQAKPPNWLDLLGQAGLLVGLFGAWLFLTGWAFAYWYFEPFGIGLTALAIPKESFFLYGFWVFRDFALETAALILVGAVASWLWRRFAPLRLARSIVAAIVALLVIAIFALGYRMSQQVATERYRSLVADDYPGLRRVLVWVDEDSTPGSDAYRRLVAELSEGCFRAIFVSQQDLFLFRPIRGLTALQPSAVVVPKSAVKAMRILAHETSCKE